MGAAEFHFGEKVWKAGLSKLKRSDVYGRTELDISDEQGRPCAMATLVDGRHVLPSGSVSLIKLDMSIANTEESLQALFEKQLAANVKRAWERIQ